MPASEWRRSRVAASGWERFRNAWRLRRADSVLLPSLTAGLAQAVPLFTLLTTGHAHLLSAAAMGCFTALYGRNEPYPTRGRMLAFVGLWLVVAVLVGSLAAATLPGRLWAVVPVALFAAASKLVSDAARVGGPGPVFPAFAVAISAERSVTVADVPGLVAIAGVCALWCWLLLMAASLWRPYAPDRIQLARALVAASRRLDAIETAGEPAARQAAGQAMQRAWRSITSRRSPTWQSAHLESLATWAETSLRRARVYSDALREDPHAETPWDELNDRSIELTSVARQLRRWGPLPDVPGDHGSRAAQSSASRAAALWNHPARQRVLRPRQEPWGRSLLELRPGSPLLPLAARVGLAALAAGLAAGLLGLGHVAWAAVSAVAVLAAMNRRTSLDRGVQRFLGTSLGLVVGLVALALHPGPLATVSLVIIAAVCAELAAEVNYVLCLMAATPLTLLLASLGTTAGATELAWDRFATTLLGIIAAAACAALIRNHLLGSQLQTAMAQVRRLETMGTEVLTAERQARATMRSQTRTGAIDSADAPRLRSRAEGAMWRERTHVAGELMAALLTLRDLFGQAQGEPWPAELPAAEVTALEADGYRMLAQLTRPPR